jgi:3-oxoacyl-[acyl-carrier protein] reductase
MQTRGTAMGNHDVTVQTMDGQSAIVTGSATGLGAAIALRLAARGARLVLNYSRSRQACEETAAACAQAGAPEVRVVCADISRNEDCRALADAASDWGRLDVLVNNAGITKHAHDHADMDALSGEDFQRLYAVNTIGPFQMTRAAKPLLVAAHALTGRASKVVMVSSIAGVKGIGSSVAYCASKGALNTMTLSLARALAPAIRVNAVCPGFIDTRWFRDAFGEQTTARIRENVRATTPLQVAPGAGDVADAAMFFCDDASRHVTGELMLIDGGSHLGTAPRA